MKIYDKVSMILSYALVIKTTMIKEYFLNYYHNSDVTLELAKNKVDVHFSNQDPLKLH